MIVTVTGIGLWTRGLTGWAAFQVARQQGFAESGEAFSVPRPEAIPARERRRAGTAINLAVEVIHQACAMARVDPSRVASVFTSAMGDTDITDYMCRKLAGEEKLLSPTKFHNSVHNAPAGYWSISAANHAPSSFVGGFRDSFAAGLLETAVCTLTLETDTALAAYDVANHPPFGDVLPITESLGLALVLSGDSAAAGWPLTLAVRAGRGTPPDVTPRALAALADANPIGTGLALLDAFAGNRQATLSWPLGSGTRLEVDVVPRRDHS